MFAEMVTGLNNVETRTICEAYSDSLSNSLANMAVLTVVGVAAPIIRDFAKMILIFTW